MHGFPKYIMQCTQKGLLKSPKKVNAAQIFAEIIKKIKLKYKMTRIGLDNAPMSVHNKASKNPERQASVCV